MLYLLFSIGSGRYVLDTAQVASVLPCSQPPRPVPGAPGWVSGVLQHNDVPIPVIDIAALALGRASLRRVSTRIAVVHFPHGDGTRLLGLLLEGLTRTVRMEEDQFQDPGIDTPDTRYLGKMATDEAGVVQRIRVEHLLPASVQALLFAEPDT